MIASCTRPLFVVNDEGFVFVLRTFFPETGDGQLDAEDAKVYWSKVKKILTNKIPSASGFSLGFFYGVSCE